MGRVGEMMRSIGGQHLYHWSKKQASRWMLDVSKEILNNVIKKMVPHKLYLDDIVEQTSSSLDDQHLPSLNKGEFQCHIDSVGGAKMILGQCTRKNACPYYFYNMIKIATSIVHCQNSTL